MSERSAISRRNILAGAAALSFGATGAQAAALVPAAVDPVFAAIAAFRAKRAAFNAVLYQLAAYEDRCESHGLSIATPTPELKDLEARWTAASDTDADAWWDFINTAPTTREGLFAFLAMLTDRDGYGGGSVPDLDDLTAICASVRAYAEGAKLA